VARGVHGGVDGGEGGEVWREFAGQPPAEKGRHARRPTRQWSQRVGGEAELHELAPEESVTHDVQS
jgi:hypothetical protein